MDRTNKCGSTHLYGVDTYFAQCQGVGQSSLGEGEVPSATILQEVAGRGGGFNAALDQKAASKATREAVRTTSGLTSLALLYVFAVG